jgi:hypothetical protein
MCQSLGLRRSHSDLGELVDNHLGESEVELSRCLNDCAAELVEPQMQADRT